MKFSSVRVLALLALTTPCAGVLRRRTAWEFDLGTDNSTSAPAAPAVPDAEQVFSVSGLVSSAQWPGEGQWDASFQKVLTGAATAPCTSTLLGRARLSPYGLGARINKFVNEAMLSMYASQSLALCSPGGVRDAWGVYFEDPGFSRCPDCDWQQGPRQYPQDGWDITTGLSQDQAIKLKRYLYGRLLALKPEAQNAVDSALSSLSLSPGSYVGVHIRRGDKVQENPLTAIEKYAEAAKKMCGQIGASKIFLASDDAQSLQMLQQALGEGGPEIVEQQRLDGSSYQLRGDVARTAMGVDFQEQNLLADVYGLARAGGFVGTASSNIGRLVYFLRSPETPAVSLDDDWH